MHKLWNTPRLTNQGMASLRTLGLVASTSIEVGLAGKALTGVGQRESTSVSSTGGDD